MIADEVGASCAVSYIGSFAPKIDYAPYPDNMGQMAFDLCVDTVQPKRSAFGVHLDPVNLIMTPRRYFENAAFLRECVDRLAPHIVSCHAKDIILHHRAALHLDEVQIGEGVLDYGAYLTALDGLGRDVPLMLEHLEHVEYAVGRDRILTAGKAAGIGFN